jgi:hypothetical protein
MRAKEALSYSVLVYKDRCGTWLKIPEFGDGGGLQVLSDDLESGLSLLEEMLDGELEERKRRGEPIPKKIRRVVRRVGKKQYGPTELELDEEFWQAEFEAGEKDAGLACPVEVKLYLDWAESLDGSNSRRWALRVPVLSQIFVDDSSLIRLFRRVTDSLASHFGNGRFQAVLCQDIHSVSSLADQAEDAFQRVFPGGKAVLCSNWELFLF